MNCVPVLENCYKTIKLNHKQTFVLEQLQEILDSWKQKEALDILLHGGDETRVQQPEQLELLASCHRGSDFWLTGTGYGLTPEKAVALKETGLTGVVLHLHHYDPEKHNAIQGFKHSYGWVLKAADSARKAQLLIGLRLCLSADFTNLQHLMSFARLARKLGVSNIQIVDPKTVWDKQKLSIELQQEHVQTLDKFTEMVNYEAEYQDWPVVSFPSALLQKLGATQHEQQALCIDAAGNMLSCSR